MQLKDWDYRISEVLGIAEIFINESQYGITYSHSGSTEYLWRLINDPNTGVFVHYEGDALAGVIIVHCDKEFQNECFGYINKMYVHPSYRGTRTGRALLDEATKWLDQKQCVLSFATATAAIGQDKLYINLVGKFGFQLHGMVLIRKGKLT